MVYSLFYMAFFTPNDYFESHQQFILFIAKQYSTVWLYHIRLLIYQFGGRLCYFQFRATTTKAAMNVLLQVFVWIYALLSPRYAPRSGMAGLYSRSALCILRKSSRVFQNC